MSKHLYRKLCGVLLLAFLASCLLVAPAPAYLVEGDGGSTAWSKTRHIGAYEKPCKMKMRKHPKRCDGEGKLRMRVSKAHKVTSQQIAKYGDVKSSNGVTLREAYQKGGDGSIKWKTFSQSGIVIPGVDVLYDERHEGMAFYNGEDVWIAANHGHDDSGYHRCGIEQQAPGFSVNNTECSENSKYMPSGTEYIQFWDYFEVAPVCKWCFPTHFDMHVNVHENGYVSFWWFDEKGEE